MKKTLLVLATLAATAGFAQAASVTLYGSVDLGLSYKYKNIDPLVLLTNTVLKTAT